MRAAKYAGLSTPHDVRVACSRLRDSRSRGIEKAPIFARPTLSRVPHNLRAWSRLISGRLQILGRISRSPDLKANRLPFLVGSNFRQQNFKCCLSYRYAIAIYAIMWLVGSKQVSSNVTMPTTYFSHVLWHDRSQRVFFAQMMSFVERYDIIDHTFLIY